MSEETISVLAQIISIVAMSIIILSMQCKNVVHFYIAQFVAAILFVVSFILPGNFAGAVFNSYSVLRAAVMLLTKKHRNPMFLIGLYAVLAGCLIYSLPTDGWVALLPFIGQAGGTWGMWSRNGKTLRIFQFAVSSPFWLAYNCIVFNIGGIGCEVFSMISVAVSVIRYGWKVLDVDQ